MRSFLFIDSSGAHVTVYIDQLPEHLKQSRLRPVKYTKDQLYKIYEEYVQSLPTPQIKILEAKYKNKKFDKKPIEGLYKNQNVIIGGGSLFPTTIDNLEEKLKDQIVIGCNSWITIYPATWCIIVDSHSAEQNWLKEDILDNKEFYLAVSDQELMTEKLRYLADVLFARTGQPDYRREFKGQLSGLGGVASAAAHLAALMGAKNILLLGIDFTDGRNSDWPTDGKLASTAVDFTNECLTLQKKYKVNIYQANPASSMGLEVMGLEDFCKLDQSV